MRYFIVEYFRKDAGKYDEQARVDKKLRDRYLSTAMVILDFKERKIVKFRAPVNAERNFDRIVDYYRSHGYEKILGTIENAYQVIKELNNPSEEDNNEQQQEESESSVDSV